MSLVSALQTGATALAVQQAAIQVTGNNISNAGNADYSRQNTVLSPAGDHQVQPGMFIGTGVNLVAVQRNVDDALLSRLRSSLSDNSSATASQNWMGRIESVFNALGSNDLSSQMNTFFNSWSNLANNPQDMSLRQVVLQDGSALASQFQDLRSQISSLQTDLTNRQTALAQNADSLAQQIADLNGQITLAEGGTGGTANSLRDQRDAALKQLSQLMDIQTVQHGSNIDVYVGSEPLVAGTQNYGVVVGSIMTNGQSISTVSFRYNGAPINVTSGEIGALRSMQGQINEVVTQLDALAHNLINQVNQIHASGQGTAGFSSITGTNAVDDSTKALNDPAAGLDFPVTNGSFVLHMTNKTTGLDTSTLVQVDLDGLNGNDTTLDSLATQLNGISGLSATVTAGKLVLKTTSSDTTFSFSQDSSGVLAALGINTFFTGINAQDIAVNSLVKSNPTLLAAAQNGQSGDNKTALAIAALESQPIASLGGQNLNASYQSMINGIAVNSAAAKNNAQATQVVVNTLTTQQQALSGVSVDEEAINLIQQQRAFQGAARFISVVDDMMKTMMNMV